MKTLHRRFLRESDEKPGDAWTLAGTIEHDSGADGKLWLRIATKIPVVCVVCGKQYLWSMEGDRCPHCEVNHGV